MNLKNFPKRLDSKTSCLRITVPENLDLALEGLIRKVLREQPKTEDIYAFAAEYFETLLQIRDKTGAKLTAHELCPFHNDEDAHEMIKLAGTFPKPSPKNVRTKPEQSKTPVRRKEPGGNVVSGEKSKNDSTKRKPVELLKQATPDLIKKLPMVESQTEKENKEEVELNEEYLTSDPIKELVEKEFMEMDLRKKKTDGKVKTENVENTQEDSKKVIETGNTKPNEEKTDTEKAVKDEEVIIPQTKASVPIQKALLPKEDSTSTKVPTVEAPVLMKDSTVSKEETPTTAQEAPLIIEEETRNVEEPNKPEETKLQTDAKTAEEQTNSAEPTKLDEQQTQTQTPKSETQQQPKPENNKPQLLDTTEKEEPIPSIPDEKETIAEQRKTEAETLTKIEPTQINTKPPEKIENAVDINQKVQETVPIPEPTTKPDENSNEYDEKTIENNIEHENNSEKVKEDKQEQTTPETPSGNDKFEDKNTKEEIKQQNTEQMEGTPMVEGTEKKKNEAKPESGNGELEIPKEGEVIAKEDKVIEEVTEKEDKDINKEDIIVEEEDEALKGEHKVVEEENKVVEILENFIEEEHNVVEKTEKVVEEVEKEDKIMKKDDEDTKKEDGEVEVAGKVVVEENKIIEKDEIGVEKENKVVKEEEKALKEEQNIVEEEHKVVEKTEKVVDGEKIVKKEEKVVKENKALDKDDRVAEEENKVVEELEKEIEDDNIFEKERKIDKVQDKLVETPGTEIEKDDKIIEKEDKIAEKQYKLLEKLQKSIEEGDKSTEEKAEVLLVQEKVTKTPENVIEIVHKEDKLVEEPKVTNTAEQNPAESRKPETEGTPLPEPKGQALENPDELCTVVDIDHLPRENNTNEKMKDHSEPTQSKVEPQQEELCMVVDIDHIPRESGTTEKMKDHSEPTLPKDEPEELCTVVDIDHIPGENKTIEQTKDHSERTLSKDTSKPEELSTVVGSEHIPTKDNITPQETTNSNPPNTDQEPPANKEPLPVPDTDHIITVEEVDTTKETGEVKIKTIQAHYYDTLQVPETVTIEYRMHSVATPIPDTLQAPTTTSSAETGMVTPPSTPSQHDTHKIESDDLLLTPTSGYSLNLSELSYQTVTGLFLDSERRYSSTEKEHENTQMEELIEKTVVHSIVTAVPIPPRDTDELDGESVVQTSEKPKDSSESLDSSNGRSEDDEIPFISIEVKTVIETQILDDEDEKIPEVEVQVETRIDIQNDMETQSYPVEESEASHGKSREEIDLKLSYDRKESDSTEATGREGSTGDSDSISSAVTEIKRTDSGKRNLGSTKGLLATQSLDLEKRNPLMKTKSFSTFRHGVTDFEVWSTIEKELEDAATKIQSKFRGYKTRKKLQRENAVQITTEESSASTTPVEAEPEEEFQQSTGEFHDSIVLSEHPR